VKLHLSYVAVRERATGKLFFLAEICHLHAGGPCAIVSHTAELFRLPGEISDDLRAKYSHVLVVIDNNERQSYEFPDPVLAKRRQIEEQIASTKAELDSARLHEASAKRLADQHKAKVVATKDKEQKLEYLQKELAKLIPSPAADPTAPVQITEPQAPANQLADCTDEQLKEIALKLELKFTGDTEPTREQIIEEILKATREQPQE